MTSPLNWSSTITDAKHPMQVTGSVTYSYESPTLTGKLAAIEQLAASIAELARQLQEMLITPTHAVGACEHPAAFRVEIPTMGGAAHPFLCRRCSQLVEP